MLFTVLLKYRSMTPFSLQQCLLVFSWPKGVVLYVWYCMNMCVQTYFLSGYSVNILVIGISIFICLVCLIKVPIKAGALGCILTKSSILSEPSPSACEYQLAISIIFTVILFEFSGWYYNVLFSASYCVCVSEEFPSTFTTMGILPILTLLCALFSVSMATGKKEMWLHNCLNIILSVKGRRYR